VKVSSFKGFQKYMIAFLQGKRKKTPWHLWPIAADHQHVVNDLIKINILGFVTVGGQTGQVLEYRSHGEEWTETQRAYLSGFMRSKTFHLLNERLGEGDIPISGFAAYVRPKRRKCTSWDLNEPYPMIVDEQGSPVIPLTYTRVMEWAKFSSEPIEATAEVLHDEPQLYTRLQAGPYWEKHGCNELKKLAKMTRIKKHGIKETQKWVHDLWYVEIFSHELGFSDFEEEVIELLKP
tara:strand:+ start:696 stop:1400 length:705 start_codon:yes stop_codon:yes gene_type:complete